MMEDKLSEGVRLTLTVMTEAVPSGYTIVRGDCGLFHAKKGKLFLRRVNKQPFGHSDYIVVLKYVLKHAELALDAHEEVPDWR